jgi:hypothetical protein
LPDLLVAPVDADTACVVEEHVDVIGWFHIMVQAL